MPDNLIISLIAFAITMFLYFKYKSPKMKFAQGSELIELEAHRTELTNYANNYLSKNSINFDIVLDMTASDAKTYSLELFLDSDRSAIRCFAFKTKSKNYIEINLKRK